jgi:hypothetical protein
VALKFIVLVGRAFFLGPRDVFIGIGWPMAVAGAAQDTARAAVFESRGIKPLFDSLEPERFFAFVFHRKTVGLRKYFRY